MIRFTAAGKKRTISLGPVTRAEAEDRLRHELADVERGIWKPPVTTRTVQADVPKFHEYADRWWLLNQGQLAESTRADYVWQLEVHLIPQFGELPLHAITFDTVEGYIAAKLADNDRIREAGESGHPLMDEIGAGRQRPRRSLSARSINITLTLLGAILETAVEREMIARNPAKGKGRRAREPAPQRSYLETAGQIRALLDAAAELDRNPEV
jgi:hypothetical protein